MKKIQQYKNIDYAFLITSYHFVNEYFSNGYKEENFLQAVVSFCTVAEKILKIKLYETNKLLPYKINLNILEKKENQKNIVKAIISGKHNDFKTFSLFEILDKYDFIFTPEPFEKDEIEHLRKLVDVRNTLIHSHLPDADLKKRKEDLDKKMGSLWEKLSSDMIARFGSLSKVEPKKKYTDDELKQVLIEEVKKKINLDTNICIDNSYAGCSVYGGNNCRSFINYYKDGAEDINGMAYTMRKGVLCPRCCVGDFHKSLDDPYSNFNPAFNSDRIRIYRGDLYGTQNYSENLYSCDRCNLELTDREFEIAKELIKKKFNEN